MTTSRIRLYLVLLVLGLSSWLVAYFLEEKQSTEYSAIDHSPDYFSVNYLKKETDQNGWLKNELFADKMVHYGDDGTTHLTRPVMTLYNAKHNLDLAPWLITAETGLLEADNEHLLLMGQVFIGREKTKKHNMFKINTSELMVTLSINFAETTEWAELLDGLNRTEGIGFEATFTDPVWINFLSKVKGRYEFN